MITFPHAKLNLGLNILRRREDGYHDIESLFIPWDGLRDVLEILPSEQTSMNLYGIELDGGDPSAIDNNLCLRAYRALAARFDLPPVQIHLWKGIPAGAGLGGGSADASATILMLRQMFDLPLDTQECAAIAATLGSDCPFFIYDRQMIASGRGEILEPFDIDLSDWRIEVAVPDVHVSTREAYAGIKPAMPSEPLVDILASPVTSWRGRLVNDFEATVFAAHPEIALVKEDFYKRGAAYASMSGSGSAVFGLFPANSSEYSEGCL